MRKNIGLLVAAAAGLALTGCDEDPVSNNPSTTFTVTIQNVSVANTLPTNRANGTVPLSPGVWAVFSGTDPMFAVGSQADAGTILIAEDGMNATKLSSLQSTSRIRSGMFDSPGGPDSGPAIFAGEMTSFTVSASPGDKLQIETMFVQSNDWFYGFSGGGLALFNGSSPISGDVTSSLALYDAGSEADTAPGTGEFQKPVQTPTQTNFGPPDPNTLVRTASFPGATIPPASAVIRITVTPNLPNL